MKCNTPHVFTENEFEALMSKSAETINNDQVCNVLTEQVPENKRHFLIEKKKELLESASKHGMNKEDHGPLNKLEATLNKFEKLEKEQGARAGMTEGKGVSTSTTSPSSRARVQAYSVFLVQIVSVAMIAHFLHAVFA